MYRSVLTFFITLIAFSACSQDYIYPQHDNEGYYIKVDGKKIYAIKQKTPLNISKIKYEQNDKGIKINFSEKNLNGTLFFGLINDNNKFPYPVFFKKSAEIKDGKVIVPISMLRGKYDMTGWEKKKYGVVGYRVMTDKGQLLYDARLGFRYKNGEFIPAVFMTKTPTVNIITPISVIIRFESNINTLGFITIAGKTYQTQGIIHEKTIFGLKPGKSYKYTVICGIDTITRSLITAPEYGSDTEFKFAYASDSRAGSGGGERNLYGTNAYILKKIFAVAANEGVSFFQFSGDLINGYTGNYSEEKLEYSNWRTTVMPFTAYFPVYVAMGNHEVYNAIFNISKDKKWFINYTDKKGRNAESIFAEEFTNPQNGPEPEKYTNPVTGNPLPSYKENAYYYIYGNTAIIVLNSNYFYNPDLTENDKMVGNLHAYIMDGQMQWLKNTVDKLEKDNAIKYIFVTLHTPVFPNGGHSTNDMWYGGDNKYRAQIGKAKIKYGIIERRDQILDLLVNKSKKTVALLTGDEHNYCRLEIGPGTKIYPDDWKGKRIKLNRTIWQINNGAAGAPYYAKENLPWTDHLKAFSTENAVVIINVNHNGRIKVKVINPDTLNIIDEFTL